MTDISVSKRLLHFLENSPTAFQAVDSIKEELEKSGFSRLQEGQRWVLKKGGKYFTTRNGSSLIAFRIPKRTPAGFMITASHADSPAFKIKTNPEIPADGYVKLNVEPYGGLLMYPWFDRPLSLAGRILVQNGSSLNAIHVHMKKDLFLIPSVAIHMNPEANNGHALNAQTDMLPVIGTEAAKGRLFRLIAEEAGVKENTIVAHDLYLYIREAGRVWGACDEFISAPHLDDLQCSYANLHGFLQAESGNSIPVMAVFDNEEVGSLTKQGAGSTFLEDTLLRISEGVGLAPEQYRMLLASSFMISADNAHAVHPNHAEKSDPINRPHMNRGPVIKYNANQHYTTDAISAAVFKMLCRNLNIPFQEFTNRSDMRGGSTLGAISNAHVSLHTVDIGLAQLAMHSCYETAGVKDTGYLIRILARFFASSFQADDGQHFTLKAK